MFIATLAVPIVINMLLGMPFLLKTKKSDRVFLFEYGLLFSPVLIWNLLIEYHVGSQSITNIVEVYLVCIVVEAYCIYFTVWQPRNPFQKVPWIIAVYLSPLVCRLAFPVLPE